MNFPGQVLSIMCKENTAYESNAVKVQHETDVYSG